MQYAGTGIKSITFSPDFTQIVITFADGSTSTLDTAQLMLKARYDSNNDGIVDDSDRLGGIPASTYIERLDMLDIDADLSNTTITNIIAGQYMTNVLNSYTDIIKTASGVTFDDTRLQGVMKKILEDIAILNNDAISFEQDFDAIVRGDYLIAGTGIGLDKTANNVTIKNTYTLPKSSSTTLGGVKVGTGLSIDANGVLSTTGGGSGGSTKTITSVSLNTDGSKCSVFYNDGTSDDCSSKGFLADGTIGTPNGITPLGADGKVPTSFIKGQEDFVTKNTAQTIIGEKTFESNLQINSNKCIGFGSKLSDGYDMSIGCGIDKNFNISNKTNGKNISMTTSGTGKLLYNGIEVANINQAVGVSNYNELTNKPLINSVEIKGNKTLTELGIADKTTVDGHTESISTLNADAQTVNLTLNSIIKGDYIRAGKNVTIDKSTGGVTINASGEGGGGATIDDSTISATKTYSSSKINSRDYNCIVTTQDVSGVTRIKIVAETNCKEVYFKAPKQYKTTDEYYINDIKLPIVALNGQAVPDMIWEANAPIKLGIENNKLYLMNGLIILNVISESKT